MLNSLCNHEYHKSQDINRLYIVNNNHQSNKDYHFLSLYVLPI